MLFGENPALEAGDVNTKNSGWDASGARFTNTLSGATADIWLGDGVEPKDLIQYQFPAIEELEDWGGRGVYMGYFLSWSGWNNAIFSLSHGMAPHSGSYEDIGIHYKHHSLDTNFSSLVNFMLKYMKFGFGQVSELAAYDIREGRITRREGAALVKKLDGKCSPKYIQGFCEWIGISEKEFWRIAEKYRGPMWSKGGDGQWNLKILFGNSMMI